MRSLRPLLGLKVSTLRAVISMLSPVCGLRPRREALRRMRKWPKPTILTSSPFSKQRKMMSKTDSTTDDDCRLDRPWLATALTRSFLVTGKRHLLRGSRASLVAPRDVRLVAFCLELTDGVLGGRPIGERPYPHAVQVAAPLGRGRGRRDRRRRRRSRRGG